MRFIRRSFRGFPAGIQWVLAALWVSASASMAAAAAPAETAVDFQRQVRPILSRYCFKCHGPDEQARQSGMRLDLREAALAPAKSGHAAIVPGNLERSQLWQRVRAPNPEDRMPPPEAKTELSPAHLEILRRWVESGAEYTPHWAFIAPQRPAPPKVRDADWSRNEIDPFVLERMEKEGLAPSPEADSYTLVRRVFLDLIGLPPSPEEMDAYLAQRGSGAYEALVDRLLASPHYGERWARPWLDLARYADTNGYEKDRPRSIWPYRDWVIEALNADMPFDRFTVAQLAGDMMAGGTRADRVATGFHRNTMLNEEGGIDPLEFRFYAMADRVGTTGTTWLGMTLQCAQCHTHKFDPIPHEEYYRFMAFLNNADEPQMAVPDAAIAAEQERIDAQIAAMERALPDRFPVEDTRWTTVVPQRAVSREGATAEIGADGSILWSGTLAERDDYEVWYGSDGGVSGATALRLEALVDERLPSRGPGRTPHGNFVLSEFEAAWIAPEGGEERRIQIGSATADHAQPQFPVAHAIDGDDATGWAIDGVKPLNRNRTAEFRWDEPVSAPSGATWVVRLRQRHGSKHTLGKIRIGLGRPEPDARPVAERRRERLAAAYEAWLAAAEAAAADWSVLPPARASSNMPLLTIQDDRSILASGDMTKRDVYEVSLAAGGRRVTAIRLEALPDERLPGDGPGRVYYEGPAGEFFLSEIGFKADGKPVSISGASHSYASGGFTAASATDGDPQTGWGINGGQGREHRAVFVLAEPVEKAETIDAELLFERYYAAGLGRFRIATTAEPDPKRLLAREFPASLERALRRPAGERTAPERDALYRQFLMSAPELESARRAIADVRARRPKQPTTLVMAERPPENPRPTRVHHRGEFLQAKVEVSPGVLSALHSWPEEWPRDRLHFARWLVLPSNPLVGRVTVNRAWASFFGLGLVRTVEDFGLQGEMPTHPALLDWLAVEFVERGWSLKSLHRKIVTSATYRQGSAAPASAWARDPENRWLARGPRVRLEAELIRDNALRAAGLLSGRLGGASVYPPQPPGVTTEGAYGQLTWEASGGADRYRRGLYTFSKRTAPFAMFSTFDALSGEHCVARREVSNSPLQALTLLNDTVFVEASQALGRAMAVAEGTVEERLEEMFRRCLVRPPGAEEKRLLGAFFREQRARFERGELDAEKVAGTGEGDAAERAAWTAVARAVMNLDEMITKG